MPHGPMKITRQQKNTENKVQSTTIKHDEKAILSIRTPQERRKKSKAARRSIELQNLARTLLHFATCYSPFTTGTGSVVSLFFDSDNCVDGKLKHLVDAGHFFAAALDVSSSHALCDGLALFGGDWCEALCLEELDACAFVTEIGFEADEDEGGCWTEMEDFWVPLRVVSRLPFYLDWREAHLVHDVL